MKSDRFFLTGWAKFEPRTLSFMSLFIRGKKNHCHISTHEMKSSFEMWNDENERDDEADEVDDDDGSE